MGKFIYFCKKVYGLKKNFEVIILDDAKTFIKKQEKVIQKKIAFTIQKARQVIDNKSFKKLDADIWEFRIRTKTKQIRLLAFWDSERDSLVVCTHGFIKKTQKTPKKEIRKAKNLMRNYLKNREE